jgi:hypothetical protein
MRWCVQCSSKIYSASGKISESPFITDTKTNDVIHFSLALLQPLIFLKAHQYSSQLSMFSAAYLDQSDETK